METLPLEVNARCFECCHLVHLRRTRPCNDCAVDVCKYCLAVHDCDANDLEGGECFRAIGDMRLRAIQDKIPKSGHERTLGVARPSSGNCRVCHESPSFEGYDVNPSCNHLIYHRCFRCCDRCGMMLCRLRVPFHWCGKEDEVALAPPSKDGFRSAT